MALISYLTKIQFDHGAIGLLEEELKILGVERPMIVTDQGVRAAGLLEPIFRANAEGAELTIFDETPGNPTEEAVEAALERYKESRCDGLIAVGGGSSIDLAKAVALLATHQPPLEQYAVILGGVDKITPDVAPLIAVPTTAGTGSEVGRAALIMLRDGRKLAFLGPNMISQRRNMRPRHDIRSAARSYRGHGNGCPDPLHRNIPVTARESARGRYRS